MSGAHRAEPVEPRLLALERHVAQRIRQRRQQIGLTQAQLAERLTVTYQMVHKYERGINRIAAGHLHAIAVALGTEVAYFFAHAEAQPAGVDQQDLHRRLDELMANVLRIADPRQWLAVAVVAKALADRANGDDDES